MILDDLIGKKAIDTLHDLKVLKTDAEARRMFALGGICINGKKADASYVFSEDDIKSGIVIISIGKHHEVKLISKK